MTRVLIYEDDTVRRYEVFDDEGRSVGYDDENKQPQEPCPTCGGTGIAPT